MINLSGILADPFLVYFCTCIFLGVVMWFWENFRVVTNNFTSTGSTPVYRWVSGSVTNNFCVGFWLHSLAYTCVTFVGTLASSILGSILIEAVVTLYGKITMIGLVDYGVEFLGIAVLAGSLYLTPRTFRKVKTFIPNNIKTGGKDFAAWWKGHFCPKLK